MTVNEASGQIRVNEIMADNLNTIADPDKGNYGDWIELYNTGSSSVSLTGYSLSDDVDNLGKWIFPQGSKISGHGFLLIWADNDDAGYHTNFRLSKGGEIIILSDKGLTVLDSIRFIEQIEDVSFGRLNDGGAEWAYFSKPSPGTSNSSGSTELVAAPPVFSMRSGFYDGKQTLELTAQSEDASIYFTLDGSFPTQSSAQYSNPIKLNNTGVVRAIQLHVGYLPSPVITKTYFIDEPTTLPVFSIVTDPDNLWDDNSGIYVEGSDYVWGWGHGNFWQDWEKPCFVEFWEANRKQKIAQAAGLKITGALTRTASQKSLRIIARSDYGKSKFSYKFFKDKDISSYNDIVLRSSGNDWAKTMFADGMMATIVSGQMDIDYNAYRPAILFLNGEYWGIHNIREKVGDDYIEENHGFDKDNLDFLSQINDVREGDRSDYNELLSFVNNNAMSNDANYKFAESRIDIQEYINYYIAQIFYANHDWPAGNIKYWKTRTEFGKWRWILFDTDLAYQQFGLNTLNWATDPNPPYEGATDLFRGLMDNEGFRNLFLNTYQFHISTTFSKDRLISIIDSLQTVIEPEIGRHIDRWRGHHGWTFATDDFYIETPDLDSYEDWVVNVEGFRQFSSSRASFLNSFVSQYFGYGTPFELVLDIDPPGSGKIWVNEDRGFEQAAIMTVFADQPLSLQPVGNIDSDFQNWVLNTGFYEEGNEVQLAPKSSSWKYLDTGQYPNSTWVSKDFDDSGWKSGPGILGYNHASAQTVINYGPDASNKYISYLFRHKFEIESKAIWKDIIIHLLRDDGAVVFLNGQEVIRSNMGNGTSFNSTATTGVDASDEDKYLSFNIPSSYLVAGVNTLVVEVH
ncbi:MAG: CotH kinase family protein [Bacteroidales bacterium]|nr:CotH kinase family protein [Bacteroidales bacterium]